MCFQIRLPIYIIVVLCLLIQEGIATAENDTPTGTATDQEHTQENNHHEQIDRIISNKLGFYASHYPEISFVVLDSANDVASNMHILNKILGEDPFPLDYEHPESLRQTLLTATLVRIELLLQTDVGSATLFKPGKDALAKRKYACIITLYPSQIAGNDRAATRHLLELTDAEFAAIPPAHYLDSADHLRFALDHEVYHCLDTIYNGPVPTSHRKHWGEYYMQKEESAADAFGLIMHIAAHQSITHYARTLRYIRGLSLLNGDINHYTYQSLNVALQQDPAILAKDNVQARFRLASHISTQVVGGYEDYLRYAQAACFLIRRWGKRCDQGNFGQTVSSMKLVNKLLNDTRKCYRALVGKELP